MLKIAGSVVLIAVGLAFIGLFFIARAQSRRRQEKTDGALKP